MKGREKVRGGERGQRGGGGADHRGSPVPVSSSFVAKRMTFLSLQGTGPGANNSPVWLHKGKQWLGGDR